MADRLHLGVIGATGWLGGLVVAEALGRGHRVTAVIRDPSRGRDLDARVLAAVADVTDRDALVAAIAGCDAVVGAYRAPRSEPGQMPLAARTAIDAARAAAVPRIVWIGGTGTLRAPGSAEDIVDHPSFPEEWRAPTLAHREALRLFRSEAGELDWTYVSVPTVIEPGERTGSYRVGGDELLVGEDGESRISAEDLAVAIVDLLERGEHEGARVTFAY